MIVDSLLVDFEGIESARKDSSEEGRVQTQWPLSPVKQSYYAIYLSSLATAPEDNHFHHNYTRQLVQNLTVTSNGKHSHYQTRAGNPHLLLDQ
jgi:hypothetical protein